MAVDLMVDFPLQRNHQVVQFAERAQLHIVERHEDDEDKNKLWYTKSDYNSMRRELKQYVLQARANDASSEEEEDSGFWIGIAHLLTSACMLEVKTCRFRCVRAVLAEQARQSPSASVGSENIALASLAETRKAVLRARKLGKLHQESIS